MSTAIPVHIALVDESGNVSTADLQQLAGALNEQIQRDFAPVWQVRASVGVYASPPANTWLVKIQTQLDDPNALGYHTDDTNNQPYALVEYTPDYAVTVSHETLEMLADPYGNRLHGARIPQGVDPTQLNISNPNQIVHYLLEVCDPCEAKSYPVGNVELSDFLRPAWYFTAPQACAHYSQTGFCTEPREVADGGYVSFMTPDNNWWQVFNEGGNLSVQNLGPATGQYKSLREFTDARAREYRSGKS